jgi:hypothetical protein
VLTWHLARVPDVLGARLLVDVVQKAGISKKVARSIGVSVDHRRKNKSVRSCLGGRW